MTTLVLVSLVLGTASVGCEHSPVAAQRLRMREETLRRTAQVWAKAEAGRPERLSRSLEFIPRNLDRHAVKLERMGQHIERWQQRDVQRWRERQPAYLDKAGRILRGKPERLEPHAVILFF